MSARKKRGLMRQTERIGKLRAQALLIHAGNDISQARADYAERRLLEFEASDALVRWRRRWERENGKEPTSGNGQGAELKIWKVAGRIMKNRGIPRRLPG